MNIQIVVFKFITDKDMFLEFYSKLFGNRLVKESSASEDQEQNMILKLKVCHDDLRNTLVSEYFRRNLDMSTLQNYKRCFKISFYRRL